MAESPEIPEAKDPFERRAALTIAIIAITLSFVGNHGDNAKTEAIIKTNQSSDQWGYFQAKGIKGQLSTVHADLLTRLSGPSISEESKAQAERLLKESERYNDEKKEVKTKAEELQQEAAHMTAINERCERAELLLQIAVVACSVSILARSHMLWLIGMILGVIGLVVGATSFFLPG